jgi:nitrogenase molybdenum-iron protein beta chain
MQDVENIVNGQKLFLKDEYQESLQAKKEFESSWVLSNPEKVEEIAEWTKSWDYREKNLASEAITVNPAKACQPLRCYYGSLALKILCLMFMGLMDVLLTLEVILQDTSKNQLLVYLTL